jgi:hypothetical protein
VPGGPWISRWLQSTRLIASIARAISSGSSPMPVYFDLAGGFKRVREHRTVAQPHLEILGREPKRVNQ